MATRATFIVQFPEFANTNAAQVNAMLAAANLEIDPEVWLEKADQGQMYLAAHKLACSPYGNNAAQVPSSSPGKGPHGASHYGAHYDALVMQVSSGYRVA